MHLKLPVDGNDISICVVAKLKLKEIGASRAFEMLVTNLLKV